MWYWRQVTIAIVSSAFTELQHHKFIALRAVVLGLIVIHIVGNAMFYLFGRVVARSLNVPLVGGALIIQAAPPLWGYPSFTAVVCLVGIASGWVVGRLHRRYQPAITLLFASSVLLYLCVFAIVEGVERSALSSGGSLARYLMNCAILFMSILLGGTLCASHRDATPSQRLSA